MAKERFTKDLFSTRPSQQKPMLVTAEDEVGQVDYVVSRILEHREEGVELKRQAVLFRASHRSAALELELTRRNIPFVKFGGLKFLEAARQGPAQRPALGREPARYCRRVPRAQAAARHRAGPGAACARSPGLRQLRFQRAGRLVGARRAG
jgi:hypothetical protein